MKSNSVLFAAVAIVAGLALAYLVPKSSGRSEDIKLPASFSELALQGKGHFEENCMTCHGKNGRGTENGPPLIHIIYEPGHHSDRSFYRAVEKGTRAHHWKFGDMPPLDHVSREKVTAIISYIREIQRENGIK